MTDESEIIRKMADAVAPVRNMYYRGSTKDAVNAADREIAKAALSSILPEIKQMVGLAQKLDKLYVYWWDLAEPEGAIMISENGVEKFEKLHGELHQALAQIPKGWK